jgi:hypothetical protein
MIKQSKKVRSRRWYTVYEKEHYAPKMAVNAAQPCVYGLSVNIDLYQSKKQAISQFTNDEGRCAKR